MFTNFCSARQKLSKKCPSLTKLLPISNISNECVVSVCHECYLAKQLTESEIIGLYFAKCFRFIRVLISAATTMLNVFVSSWGRVMFIRERVCSEGWQRNSYLYLSKIHIFKTKTTVFKTASASASKADRGNPVYRQDKTGGGVASPFTLPYKVVSSSTAMSILSANQRKTLSSSNQQSPYFPYLQQPSLHLLRIKT